MEDSVVVFLEEEHGYRYWMWSPGMSEDDLASWWKAMPTVAPYFYHSMDNLPGTVVQIFQVEVDGKWAFRTRRDSSVQLPDTPPSWWTCKAHMHTDDDSGLRLSDGEQVLHAGYVDPDDYHSDDYVVPPDVAAAWEEAMLAYTKKLGEGNA